MARARTGSKNNLKIMAPISNYNDTDQEIL